MTYSKSDLSKMLRDNPDLLVEGEFNDLNYSGRCLVQEKPTAKLSEHDLQAQVIAECDERAATDTRYARIFHPASGEYRTKATAAKLKRMGVRRGLLDLYLIYPNQEGKAGWACELKVGKNRPTPEQKAEMKYLLSVGWVVECIWDDVQAVIDSLERYLG